MKDASQKSYQGGRAGLHSNPVVPLTGPSKLDHQGHIFHLYILTALLYLYPMIERTFIMLKPGTLQRRIIGEVLSRFERKGLKIIALKLLQLDKALVEAHYAEHKGRDYYGKLVDYTLSGPIVALILEGEDAIFLARRLAGPVTLTEQIPGTIRGDFAACTRLNIIHSSDSAESALREMALFFNDGEICSWEDGNARWFIN